MKRNFSPNPENQIRVREQAKNSNLRYLYSMARRYLNNDAISSYLGIYTRPQGRNVNLPIGLESKEVRTRNPHLYAETNVDIHIDVDPYDKKADRPCCLCRVECD